MVMFGNSPLLIILKCTLVVFSSILVAIVVLFLNVDTGLH